MSSGTKVFTFDAAEAVEEAFERCGRESRVGYDIETSLRSMNFMLSAWSNKGINLWTVKQRELPMKSGIQEYILSDDIVDIITSVIVRSGSDLTMVRISQKEFITIPVKTTLGRPSQWYVDRQIIPVLKLYPTPENSTDILKYDALTRIEDVSKATDGIAIPFRFYDAFVADLAARISYKKAPDRTAILEQKATISFDEAAAEDGDRVTFRVTPDTAIYYRTFR